MKVYLYSGMQNLIEKSGVGRAFHHQEDAAKQNNIELVQNIEEADVVHINTVFPNSLLMSYLSQKKKVPVIYHAHSTKEDFRNSYLGSNMFSEAFCKWIKLCYESADIIITPTKYSKSLLRSYGITKPIEVVSNGIDLNYYNRKNVEKGSFRNKYGYKKDDKIVMCVGLIIDRKGILDFVELAKKMPEYEFIWFGEANLRAVTHNVKKAVQTKLPNLKFPGYINKEELREAYRDCDLFLFPSKEETEGIVVLEALAMKVPVLLRDIPVYKDWLVEDRDVYKASNLDEFEVKIKDILEGKSQSLVENGYKVVQNKTIEKVGERFVEIYKMAIEGYSKNNKD